MHIYFTPATSIYYDIIEKNAKKIKKFHNPSHSQSPTRQQGWPRQLKDQATVDQARSARMVIVVMGSNK